jgi:hypothetical protein
MKVVFSILISGLLALSLYMSGVRIDLAREGGKNFEVLCIKNNGGKNHQYCGCLRDYSENVNAPHTIVDRLTFGYFWSKKEAIDTFSDQLNRCNNYKKI